MVIGFIGIFVPVLPTTPFLLLAAFCYLRGSCFLYAWLVNNRLTGSYIKNYMEGRGMTLKMKIWTIALLWTTIVLTAIVGTDSLVIRIILAAVLIGVTVHIVILKTARNESGVISIGDNPDDRVLQRDR